MSFVATRMTAKGPTIWKTALALLLAICSAPCHSQPALFDKQTMAFSLRNRPASLAKHQCCCHYCMWKHRRGVCAHGPLLTAHNLLSDGIANGTWGRGTLGNDSLLPLLVVQPGPPHRRTVGVGGDHRVHSRHLGGGCCRQSCYYHFLEE